MEKPWIGIPTRYHEKSEYIGQIRHYLDAILWAGGLPLMIPTVDHRAIIADYVAREEPERLERLDETQRVKEVFV